MIASHQGKRAEKTHTQPEINGTSTPEPPSSRPKTAVARLRAMLADKDKIIVCPGVYDGFTARIALQQGFDCLYMTGAGTSISRLGQPDLGLATLNDMSTNAAMLASLDRTVPLIADADTGYGGPLSVRRTIHAYMLAGVAGLHIEDQVVTKRCGHLGGKELVDRETYYARIRAAVLSREELRGTMGEAADIVLIARTDALQSFGFEEAIERLEGCVEIGVDAVFLEGVTSIEQCREVCRIMAPTPVLLNLVPGGVTPDVSVEEARELGFKIVIYPGLAMTAVYAAVSEACEGLKRKGKVEVQEQQRKGGVKGLFELAGLKECMEFDERAGGKSYAKGV